MFELQKHKAKIAHLNIRGEMHGDDEVLAIDVRLQADVANDFLSYLAPTLKWSLYDKSDSPQGELVEDQSHLPKLRYSQLPPLAWRGEMEKALFVVHGAKKAQDLEFEAKVHKLLLDCKDGGTVSIQFQASLYPTAEESGQLAGMLGQEHKISVRGNGAEPGGGDV
jgi:hypothetical protein